jgi:hypothetical protein
LLGQNGVHQLRGADDSVDRTGLNTQGATDTKLFINDSNLQWLMRAATGIEPKNWLLQ